MDRRSFLIGTTASATALAAGAAFAQATFPSRTITILNAFPPGGANDIVTRPLAAALEQIVKQPVVVETIRTRELSDLYLLGAKGRQRLHELLDKGDSQMIPTIALVDRTFQQRRLLEGGSTANIGFFAKLIIEADAKLGVPEVKQAESKQPKQNQAE
jgi:hypothetical protein